VEGRPRRFVFSFNILQLARTSRSGAVGSAFFVRSATFREGKNERRPTAARRKNERRPKRREKKETEKQKRRSTRSGVSNG
jgi:hypothetical protein